MKEKNQFLLLGAMTHKQECFAKYDSLVLLLMKEERSSFRMFNLLKSQWGLERKSCRMGNYMLPDSKDCGDWKNHPKDKRAHGPFSSHIPINSPPSQAPLLWDQGWQMMARNTEPQTIAFVQMDVGTWGHSQRTIQTFYGKMSHAAIPHQRQMWNSSSKEVHFAHCSENWEF